jgi:predicted metal-dependent hydrolase
MPGNHIVEVRRSARRRRTVSAYREGDTIVVLMPARTSKADEVRLVSEMVGRVTEREAKLARRGPRASDAALSARAAELSRLHLDARARPGTVRWVTNMEHRWGSCTPAEGSIRLSHRLQMMPQWVIDYVLVHELAHLLEGGHGPDFWAWVDRYPQTERARGFLEGVASARQLPGGPHCEGPDEPAGGSSESSSVKGSDPSDPSEASVGLWPGVTPDGSLF